MSQRFPLMVGLAIAVMSLLAKPIFAAPLLPPPPAIVQPRPAAGADTNAPICFIQFQGSSAIDVSPVCGRKLGETPNSLPVNVSNAATPPVFDPKTVNASTTGQCNFVDANGNPCP